MHHFIISFQVIVNGLPASNGVIGTVVPTTDYNPNLISRMLESEYQKQFPIGSTIQISLGDAVEVKPNEYYIKSSEFVKFTA